jgi:protein-tyrosine kinase
LNIIEQAARRLEELQRGGVEVPRRQGAVDSGAAAGRTESGRGATDRAAGAIRRTGASDKASARRVAPSAQVADESASKQVEIDLARLAAMGYVTPENSRAQIASEFRVIKRPLLMNVQGRSAAPVDRANLIMVTSSLPGEGKTFVAVNLAVSIAMEMDCRVLLVDADVSRPAVLQRLGLPVSPGLLDLLTDSSLRMSDTLLRTNIDRLSILPAGATPIGFWCSTRRPCCCPPSRVCWRAEWAKWSWWLRRIARCRVP